MPTIEANAQRFYYEEHGEGEPLFCVMGLGADHLSWMLQLPAFSERYRTIIFDNRDVGQSSYVEGSYEVTDMAADALALADKLELDSFHLLGVSMGGAIAQEMALAAPQRMRSLTLAVTWSDGGEFARHQAQFMGEDAMRLTFEQQVDRILLLLLSEEFYNQPGAADMARNLLLSNPHPQQPEGFARQVDACGRHHTRGRLASLEMPVHVIGAEYDVLVPVWKSREISEQIPGAKYSELERAAHGIQIERADEFNSTVLDFLAAHSGAAAAA